MLFYNSQNINILENQCNNLQETIKSSLLSQKKKNKLLCQCISKVSYDIETLLDVDNVSDMLNLLEDLKHSLSLSESNSNKLNQVSKKLQEIQNNISSTKAETNSENSINNQISEFNELYIKTQKEIIENIMSIDDFLYSFIKSCNFAPVNSISENINSTTQDNTQPNNTPEGNIEAEQDSETRDTSNKITEVPSISDNRTLIISEKSEKVFLPYTAKDIQDLLEKYPNDYANFEDVIEKKYVVPISKYKNPFFARFKEAFILMKHREKASLPKCLDLALELSCNTLLNPAIITACKNLDELDIYLDYLSNNELDKFKLFEIIYEVAPSIK